MTAYLVANPPRIRQFRPRTEKPSGVCVVHTAENTPDWVGPDSGAEAVAAFIRDRTDYGSYHVLADSDSRIRLVPFSQQAYGDGTGSNPHAFHVSAATQAAKWGQATRRWRRATVRQMARGAATYAKWLKRHHGIAIPARRITRAQSEARIPGFLSHAERDPGRRSDPGAGFPWRYFLARFKAYTQPKATPNITAAIEATKLAVRRRAMRRVARRGSPGAKTDAKAWLAADSDRSSAGAQMRAALRRLRTHER